MAVAGVVGSRSSSSSGTEPKSSSFSFSSPPVPPTAP
ncbi:Uncharacterised protein [Flavonifractor plautii]|uniref:Uncharacterized protein n=1 Tax=Flavonifractor plautii TaxID=292800 RepID=A0A174KK83_FLAPL|nr:Uncharacterised protein [Flavonifractor plautii]